MGELRGAQQHMQRARRAEEAAHGHLETRVKLNVRSLVRLGFRSAHWTILGELVLLWYIDNALGSGPQLTPLSTCTDCSCTTFYRVEGGCVTRMVMIGQWDTSVLITLFEGGCVTRVVMMIGPWDTSVLISLFQCTELGHCRSAVDAQPQSSCTSITVML